MANLKLDRRNLGAAKEFLFNKNNKYLDIDGKTPAGTVFQYYNNGKDLVRKNIIKRNGAMIFSDLSPSLDSNRIAKVNKISEMYPEGTIVTTIKNDGTKRTILNSFTKGLVSFDSGTKEYRFNGELTSFEKGKKLFDNLIKFLRSSMKKSH